MLRLLIIILLTILIAGGVGVAAFFYYTVDYSAFREQTPQEIRAKRHQEILNKSCKAFVRKDSDGPSATEMLARNIAKSALQPHSHLDTKIKRWNGKEKGQKKCLFDDGRPFTVALSEGYSKIFNLDSEEKRQAKLKEIIAMHEKHPKSASIALLKAKYWIDYAWYARGSGFSSTVTNDGFRLFKERMRKAEQVLIESKPYASEIPLWYSQMIMVQNIIGRSPQEIDQTFLEGVKKDKLYYPQYYTMLNYSMPKWGGTWGTVENLINWSVKNTKETEGYALYARLYQTVNDGLLEGKSLFKDTHAEWPKMKKGFEDMMERYPNSNWNLNNYAKFACMAIDKETFLELRAKIDHNIHEKAWQGSPTLDICEIKFGYEE